MESFFGLLVLFALARLASLGQKTTARDRPPRRFPVRRVVLPFILVPALSTAILHTNRGPLTLIWALLWLCFWFAFIWPEAYLAFIAIPRGWVRLSWLLDRMGGGSTFALEAPASWALPAARAFVRKPSAAKLQFIERKLARCPELPTSAVVAHALIALQRGDRETARDLCDALHALDPHELPLAVRKLATDVLTIDALVRDRPREAGTFAVHARSGALARLIALLMRRKRTPLAIARIWLAWAFTSQRRHSRRLVARWLPRPRPPVTPHPTGIQAYVALVSRPQRAGKRELHAAVAALDALREDAEFRALCAQHAAPSAALVLEPALRELYQLMLDERMPLAWLPETGEVASALRVRVREERFARLRMLIDALKERLEARKDLSAIDEWRAWAVLRRAAAEAAADAGDRSSVFRIVYPPLTSYLVRLANVRGQRVLARAVSMYARELGAAAGAREAQKLLESNVQATAADRLPAESLFGLALLSDLSGVKKWRWLARAVGLAVILGSAYVVGHWLDASKTSGGHRPDGGGELQWLLAIACSIALSAYWVASYVDVWLDDEELTVQNKQGRQVLCAGDVEHVRALGETLVYFRLQRRPLWLKRHLLTVTSSAGHTERLVAQLARRSAR